MSSNNHKINMICDEIKFLVILTLAAMVFKVKFAHSVPWIIVFSPICIVAVLLFITVIAILIKKLYLNKKEGK